MQEFLRRILFLPEQASTFAERVDGLHYFVIITTMIVSTAVGMTSLFFFVRYRRRHDDETTKRITPPVWIEVLFVVVPLAFFLWWFAVGYRDSVYLAEPPKNALDVYVMGKQWMWKFAYPEGPNAVSVLRVPAHRPVRLLLTSRDVIHSFFVPEFRIKQDAVPGRYTQTWFTATKPGRYQIFCAEYCGTEHSKMLGDVIVMEPSEFDDWLEQQRRSRLAKQDSVFALGETHLTNSNLVDEGRKLSLSAGCVKCHTTDGTEHIGPTWLDLYAREETLIDGLVVKADEAYLTESMMDPNAKVVRGFTSVMPTYKGRLTAPEVAALLEFIKSLRSERLEDSRSARPSYERVLNR
jgi:cytochrome c oxidase subunit 2